MNNELRNTLRQEILARRDSLTSGEREDKNIFITSRIMSMSRITAARTVLIYMHFRSEVQTLSMIRQMLAANQIVSIPFTRPDTSQLMAVRISAPDRDVIPGYCGIPEPRQELVETASCDPAKIDVVIVPGSVFDRRGGRLGYGGGYYDRFLKNKAPGAIRIGLAFELQMVDRVPVEKHDQFMDFVVTEDNLYVCGRNRYAQNSGLSR